jgi:hypothetical protein
MEEVSRVVFKAGELGPENLVSGWSEPEEGHTWSIGTESVFQLAYNPPENDFDLQLELGLFPFVAEPRPVFQRLEVVVDGLKVGSEKLHGLTWVGFRLPRLSTKQSGCLTVKLVCPDAVSPASLRKDHDRRKLGFGLFEAIVRAVSPAIRWERKQRPPAPIIRYSGGVSDSDTVKGLTGLTVAELALRFESLGTNCEFGLFQRRCGVEPSGLLRYAGISYFDMVRGIVNGFAGIADVDSVSCQAGGPDDLWMVSASRYGLTYHTFRSRAEVSENRLLAEHRKVLHFRREKLKEIMATGEKLFVVMRPEGMSQAQAVPLITALRRFGPNTLLFIGEETGKPAGSVEALAPDLFCGSMDGVSKDIEVGDIPGNDTWLGDRAMTAWLSICANAYRLWRESGRGS